MEELKSASFEGKTKVGIPKDATILKKDVSITVEEIENGFIIRKSYDIKYYTESEDGEKNTQYEYYTKKWYSEDNPIQIDEDFEEEMSLAEKFEG